MPNSPITAQAFAWETTFSRLDELNLYLTHAPAHEQDAVQREIAALQDELLDTPAPSITAVLQKLGLIWEGELHGLDQGSRERCLVLDDLASLIDAHRALLSA